MNQAIMLHPHDHKKNKDWQTILDLLDANLNSEPIDSVLELGGGLGNIAYRYAVRSANTVVEDINDDYLQWAKNRHPRINILKHDINTPLPLPQNSFKLVTCTGTLHYGYIKNADDVVREMIRVSEKYLLIDLLSRYAPYRFLEKIYNPQYHPRTYTAKEATRWLQAFNLRIIDCVGSKTFSSIKHALPFTGKTVYFLLEKHGEQK